MPGFMRNSQNISIFVGMSELVGITGNLAIVRLSAEFVGISRKYVYICSIMSEFVGYFGICWKLSDFLDMKVNGAISVIISE